MNLQVHIFRFAPFAFFRFQPCDKAAGGCTEITVRLGIKVPCCDCFYMMEPLVVKKQGHPSSFGLVLDSEILALAILCLDFPNAQLVFRAECHKHASTVSNSYSVPVTTVAGLVYNYDVTGLTNGTIYYFAVKAVNPGGNSDYSNELSAMPQVAEPGAPVNVIQSGNIATLKNSKIECLGSQPEWVWFKQGSSLKNGILAYWTPNEFITNEERQAIINVNNDPSSSRYKIADVLFFYGDGAVIKGGDGKNEYKVFKEVTTGLWYFSGQHTSEGVCAEGKTICPLRGFTGRKKRLKKAPCPLPLRNT